MVTKECSSKVCLISWNLISAVVGVVLCIAGLLIMFGPDSIKWFNERTVPIIDAISTKNSSQSQLFDAVSIFFICMGAVLAAVGFLGVFLAPRLTLCLVVFYVTSVIICLIGQIALLAVFYTFQYELRDQVKPVLINLLPRNGTSDVIRNAWDSMHQVQECCGATGAEDYLMNTTDISKIPKTCCGPALLPCQGCITKVTADLQNYDLVVGVIAAGLFIVEILLIVLAIMVFQMKEDEKEEERQRTMTLERTNRTLDRLPLQTLERMNQFAFGARSLDRLNAVNKAGSLDRLNSAYHARSMDRLNMSNGSMDRLDMATRAATLGRDRTTGHL